MRDNAMAILAARVGRKPLAVVTLLAISACSGGGGRVQSVPPMDGTTGKLSGSTLATLRIVIPARPTAATGAARRAQYISYATQSIKAVFTPNGGGSATTFTQNVTPTSPGCQGNLNSSTTCTLKLPGLNPGSYTAAFTMYDGMLDGSNVPTGNILSANQSVPVTIAPGQANVIAVTLDGVPVALAVIPGAASTLSGSRNAGYSISKCIGFESAGTESITVLGIDADQNYILGSGAPAPALNSSDTSMAAVATPAPNSPNAFALTRPATPATARASFNLTASVTPIAGSGSTTPITATVPVTFDTTVCGVVSTLAGNASPGYADGTGAAAQFYFPFGVAVDGGGNVYVADANNNRIRKVTSGGIVTTLAGSTQGSADGTGNAAQFYFPSGVAVDGSGNVYVADSANHRIRKITSGGVVTTLAGGTQGFADGTGAAAQFSYPYYVAVDGSDNVYVADSANHRIRKITSGGVVTTLAGGTQGFADGTGAAAQFNTPFGVAVDGSGNIYIADQSNERIRKITSGGVVTTLAGSTQGFADGTGAAAQFDTPYGVAVDSGGNVYVADSANQRIRKIASGGVVTTLAGSTQGFADGTGAAAQFRDPYGVAVDASGTVYVADYSNQRIRKIQ